MQQAPGQGGMLAVAASHKQLTGLLPGLGIAAINSAQHCVLSGQIASVEQAKHQLEEQGIDCTPLQVSHAFHSRLMEPVLSPMLSANAVEAQQVFASVRPKQADSLLHCAARLYFLSGIGGCWMLPICKPSMKIYWLRLYRA